MTALVAQTWPRPDALRFQALTATLKNRQGSKADRQRSRSPSLSIPKLNLEINLLDDRGK